MQEYNIFSLIKQPILVYLTLNIIVKYKSLIYYIIGFKSFQMLELSPRSKYKNRNIYKPPPKDDNSTNYKKLIIVIVISFFFISGEFIGGYISHSISVISDAFHLVTDLLGFVVSFVFLWFSKKKPNKKMTFGYHRTEIIGALGNLFIIWTLAFFFLYEATNRIINKQFVENPLVMLIVACVGLPINIIMYFVLHGSGSHSHGLMAEPCGQQYPTQNKDSNMFCSEMICEDIQCLITHEYEQHCHKKEGENEEIHKHQVKVIVEGDKIKRKSSAQMNEEKKNQHKHHGHDHDHKDGHKCSHDHQNGALGESAENIHKISINQQRQAKKEMKKNKDGHNHQGHNCKDHKHEEHKHNHEGHDHQSHDHNHEGHDHQGHSHQGHSHEGHNHGAHSHSHESMSMQAAILHALSDVIQSIGLIISALIIFFAGSDMGKEVTEWNNVHYCDPITTYIFCAIVLVATFPIAKNCYNIIMESTPGHISIDDLTQQFLKVEGVMDVHDIHIWELRPGKSILIAHVFSRKGQQTRVLKQLTDMSRRKRIFHSTFQVEQQQLKHHEGYILCDHDIH